NHGIFVTNGARVASTGTATVTLNGTGGVGAAYNAGLNRRDGNNYGVYLNGATTSVSSVSGDLTIQATGGGGLHASDDGIGGVNRGLYLVGARISSTGTGANAAQIRIYGTGGLENDRETPEQSFTGQNMGIYTTNNAVIESVDGDISLEGIGLPGSSNIGLFLYNGTTIRASGAADISLAGAGP